MSSALKVLIVEDSEEDAQLILRFIQQYQKQIEVLRVENEVEMFKALDDGNWNLIVSDYNLPTFSGLQALEVLKKSGQDIPLILVSGTIGEDVATGALKAGATDYVLKSNLSRLPNVIERAINEAKSHQILRRIQHNLNQSKKMEAVGRFAGGLAHDVNNILTAITLYAEMAIKQLDAGNTEVVRSNIESILKSKKIAANIIGQVLQFSRQKNETNVHPIDVTTALVTFEPILKRLLSDKINLTIETPEVPLMVMANQTQLEQIFLNLTMNARDAITNQEGLVTIKLERIQLEEVPANLFILVKPGSYITIKVNDNGRGMDEGVVAQIFEPYFTTKEPDKGTGLGLSLVYGILHQLKGSVSVESIFGKGTTFTIYLPACI
ncbi:MAG: response regulator [Bacteriovoracaceae bacterium]|nr:response regulator [Bacteriovoracaceae bacterium]